MQRLLNLSLCLALLVAAACTTRGRFVIPEGTDLQVYGRPVTLDADGVGVMRPFFWNAAGVPPSGGVPYKLLKNGEVVQEGKLRVRIRPASFFWPPFAQAWIYWPIGLQPNITYDLVKGTQE